MTEDRIYIAVTDASIGYEIAEKLPGSTDGAVVVFVGVVRDSSEGKAVERLDYEAYSEMAEREMRKLTEAAIDRWEITSVAVSHRVGQLQIGEISVVVAVAAPHRGSAFDACEWIIDTLKETVPIWKKELFADGTSHWVNHP